MGMAHHRANGKQKPAMMPSHAEKYLGLHRARGSLPLQALAGVRPAVFSGEILNQRIDGQSRPLQPFFLAT